MYSQATTL
ncbi:hypothetical protein GQ600_13364 [Phytophthora cactorum]|nr:hypothetical protein GQ600_13364 [Phytophthora cactorum]